MIDFSLPLGGQGGGPHIGEAAVRTAISTAPIRTGYCMFRAASPPEGAANWCWISPVVIPGTKPAVIHDKQLNTQGGGFPGYAHPMKIPAYAMALCSCTAGTLRRQWSVGSMPGTNGQFPRPD